MNDKETLQFLFDECGLALIELHSSRERLLDMRDLITDLLSEEKNNAIEEGKK